MDEILDGLYGQARTALHQVVKDSGIQAQLPGPAPTTQVRQKRARTAPRPNPGPTHYDTLEVSPRASQETITGAYRALARKYHPDHNKGKHAANRMLAINQAYEVLRDPAKRSAYDKTLK